jgi:hypothetical protein
MAYPVRDRNVTMLLIKSTWPHLSDADRFKMLRHYLFGEYSTKGHSVWVQETWRSILLHHSVMSADGMAEWLQCLTCDWWWGFANLRVALPGELTVYVKDRDLAVLFKLRFG